MVIMRENMGDHLARAWTAAPPTLDPPLTREVPGKQREDEQQGWQQHQRARRQRAEDAKRRERC